MTDRPQAFGSGGVSAPGSAGGSGAFSTAGGGALPPDGLAVADPHALPQAPQALLHGAQWLAHWIGAAVQQVAAGAHGEQAAVWHGAQLVVNAAVWHGAHDDRVAQWLTWWQRVRRAQHSSSSSSARTCGARTASMAANIEAVISRCIMVSLLKG